MGRRSNHKKLILVVEDDIRSSEILARMLREDGHEVTVAHDGQSALAQLSRAQSPDILVTDMQLPSGDGFTVALFARTRQPALPVFFVTGYPDRVSRRLKSLDPEPHVFVKPLDYAALAAELAGVPALASNDAKSSKDSKRKKQT